MSAIQVKNVPPELHSRIRQRASIEGVTLSEYVLGVLDRDLALPSKREWLESLRKDEPVTGIRTDEIVELIHAGRAERDEQIKRAIDSRD